MPDEKTPLISVVMPVWNVAEYLSAALDSVIKQTFSDWELIVIDDNSTDRSVEIVKDYQRRDGRIKLFSNEFAKGLAGAINSGLRQARGKYLARADGDDLNRPNRFRLQYDFLESHPEIYLLGGGYAPFNEQGTRMNIFRPASSLELAWLFLSDTYFCHPTIMFRREIIEQTGLYRDCGSEDFYFFSQALRRYRGANLPQILVDYRERSGNYSLTHQVTIAKSVKEIFQDNYQYYVGNLEWAEEFFQFQTADRLAFKNFYKIFQINLKILAKICRQYQLSCWSKEYLLVMMKLGRKYLRLVCRQLKFLVKKSLA